MDAVELSRTSDAHTGANTPAEISRDVSQYLSGRLTPVTLRRIAPGNCTFETTERFVQGSVQQLRCTTSTGAVITLLVRIGSSRPPAFGPRTFWLVEGTFTHADFPAVREQIRALMIDATPDRRVA